MSLARFLSFPGPRALHSEKDNNDIHLTGCDSLCLSRLTGERRLYTAEPLINPLLGQARAGQVLTDWHAPRRGPSLPSRLRLLPVLDDRAHGF